MPNGFSGSRDLHVRWRRRLVQGDERRAPKRFRIDPPHVPQPDGEPLPPPVLTVKTGIRSIIPRDAWKIWAMISVAGTAWLAVMVVGVYADASHAAWEGLLGLEAGHTSRWFGATSLLAAAQLSFLILWHRSLSRKDFFGRFRLWYWTGLVWLAFCAAEATTLHLVAARWMESYYRLKVWNGVTVCWMLVAAPIAIGVMRLLRREMHLCRTSSFLLRCSAGAAAVSAVATLTGPLLPQTALTTLISAGATTLWQLLLACSTLMHTRFVIHVTNEVAPKMRVRNRPSRLADLAGSAVMTGLKGAVWLPWQAVELTPLSRLWRRRSVMGESPAAKTRKRAPGKTEAKTPAAGRPLWIRVIGGTLGGMRSAWTGWSERRAARKVERDAARETLAAERQVQAAAKAEAKRIADEERTAKRAAEGAEREAARLKAEAERQRGLEKAKTEREAADRERAAAQAREKAQRDAAERDRAAVQAREKADREAAQRAKEAAQAAAREAEQTAAAAKAAAARQAAAKTPAPQSKAEIPRPKANFERSAPVSTAIKPQHVSYSDDEEEEAEGEDDTRGMSRKERKRMKKMAKNRE